jgi:hypothetical protein
LAGFGATAFGAFEAAFSNSAVTTLPAFSVAPVTLIFG